MNSIQNFDSCPFQTISRGGASGSYQAFPDVCRLRNGDIIAVFYAGYGHVSFPNAEYPRGGRICLTRSHNEGRTWSEPKVIYDDANDNRDPHIAQLSDGTVICSFFSLSPCAVDDNGSMTQAVKSAGAQLTRSGDGGQTWEQNVPPIFQEENWFVSAPVRELSDGTCALGVYCEKQGRAWGGVTISHDGGKSWSTPVAIGRESNLVLPAETDVIQLEDGSLLAALRGDENQQAHLHFSHSSDNGLSWSPVEDSGFFGHCPHLARLSSGEILLTYRAMTVENDAKEYYVGLRVSRDEGRTWQGPFVVDTVSGAYASTLELKDRTVLIVYYEEGPQSAIRARRFRRPIAAESDQLEFLELS